MKVHEPISLVISCEHGGNQVPEPWSALFTDHKSVLYTHRAYDPGALELARFIANLLNVPLIANQITRLLVELNRSPNHPRLYSEYTRTLSPVEREKMFLQVYKPYRDKVEKAVHDYISEGRQVVHLSVHTFSPEIDGKVRDADIGLLYDPAFLGEKQFCIQWQQLLKKKSPRLSIRRNYPYRGNKDGFTTFLRKKWAGRAGAYLGLELEVNQRYYWNESGRAREALRISLAETLLELLASR